MPNAISLLAEPALQGIDPITLEVVCEGLVAVVREMRATTIRSSYSSVIYEFDDFVMSPDGLHLPDKRCVVAPQRMTLRR